MRKKSVALASAPEPHQLSVRVKQAPENFSPEQPPLRLALRMNQAAESIGISVRKLYDLVDRGEIRTIKIGRCVLVPTRELAAFIERLEDEQRAQ